MWLRKSGGLAAPVRARPGPPTFRRPSASCTSLRLPSFPPDEYPGELGTSYGQACAALRLPASPAGCGLVLDLDDGCRWTRAVTDAEGVRGVQSFWNTGMEAGYEPPDGTIAATLPGWPVDCGLGLSGLHSRGPSAGVRRQWPSSNSVLTWYVSASAASA
jgi:hypothetical protein